MPSTLLSPLIGSAGAYLRMADPYGLLMRTALGIGTAHLDASIQKCLSGALARHFFTSSHLIIILYAPRRVNNFFRYFRPFLVISCYSHLHGAKCAREHGMSSTAPPGTFLFEPYPDGAKKGTKNACSYLNRYRNVVSVPSSSCGKR